jgi:methionyl-tRNA synthetase
MDYHISTTWIVILVIAAVWETVWKGIALWRAAHRNEMGWFIAVWIINSVGILPIYYLMTHKAEVHHEKA